MSLLSALSIGRSALRAATAGIDVTAHNVSNAMTPGFGRQRVELLSAGSHVDGHGLWLGSGASVVGFVRTTDTMLGIRQTAAAADGARSGSYAGLLEGAEIYFNETSSNGPALVTSAFFDALDAATVDPSDGSLRAAVVASAVDLGATVSATREGLVGQQAGAAGAFAASVIDINALLADVAAANSSITNGGATPDTLDAIDTAVRGLAELAGATMSVEPNGTTTVYIGGHAAVSGDCVRTVTFDDSTGSPRLLLSTGSTTVDLTPALDGAVRGQLDAIEEIETWISDLDAFAEQFASLVNTQLAAGFDLAGNPGAPLFTVGVPAGGTLAVNAAMTNDPSLLAFSSDPFGGPVDGGNLVLLTALSETGTIDGQPPEQFLSALASRVATSVSSARSAADQDASYASDLDALQIGVSGVNLDEEAANLIVWQAAYQAAAAVIAATDETLSFLMELV